VRRTGPVWYSACDTAPHTAGAAMRHHKGMARSAAQSDFSVAREPEVELPDCVAPVALPSGEMVTDQAGVLATRWVMRITVLMLFALAVLCAVGPHIPSGE